MRLWHRRVVAVTSMLVEWYRDVADNDPILADHTFLIPVAATVNNATNRVPHPRGAMLIITLPNFEDRASATTLLHFQVEPLVDV
jgi:hypothetical protein